MASRRRDGSAKWAPVVATTPTPEMRCQLGQHRVAFVVERLTVMGQFDADPAGGEPVHQIGQRPLRRFRPTVGKCLAHSDLCGIR